MENRFIALERTIKAKKSNGGSSGTVINVQPKTVKKLIALSEQSNPKISFSKTTTPVSDHYVVPIVGKVVNASQRPVPELKIYFKELANTVTGEFLDLQPLVIKSTTNAKGEFFLGIKLSSVQDPGHVKACIALEGEAGVHKLDLISASEAQAKLDDLTPGKTLAQLLKKFGVPAEQVKNTKQIAIGTIIRS